MSKNEFNAADELSISVERSDDEEGAVILTIVANGDTITISAGWRQSDADSLRGELEGAAEQARDIDNQWEDRPDTEDGFVSDGRDGYYATLSGKTMPDRRRGFPSRDIAIYELARMLAAEPGWTPNVWYEGERGIKDMINDEVYAHLDEDDKLKPLPGVRYNEYDSVRLAGDDWPHYIVDGDYGDLGVMVHTAGDPDVFTLATHDQLTPYDDEDDQDDEEYDHSRAKEDARNAWQHEG